MRSQRLVHWLPVLERLGIAVAVAFIYMGYFLINDWLVANQVKAYVPLTFVDRAVPFVGEWLYIYALCLISVFWPMAVVRERYLFRRIALAYLFVQVVAWVCFVLVPVQTIHRPTGLTNNTFLEWGLQLCYWLDLPYCCFPSLHVGMSVMAALACWKVDRVMGGVALVLAALIGASTLFVKQHYFVDVVGGFVSAGIAYRLFIVPFPTEGIELSRLRFSRVWTITIPIVFFLGVSAAYVAYKGGWVPWQK